MDLLVGGSDRPRRQLPRRVVAVVAVLALVATALVAARIHRTRPADDDVSGVVLRLVVEQTRRAGDGSAYGVGRVEAADPAGRAVELRAVDVDVPGLRVGRRVPDPASCPPRRRSCCRCGSGCRTARSCGCPAG